MRRARPLTEANHLQCHGAVQTFLPCPIDYALSAAPDLLEQFVIAKLHFNWGRLLLAVPVVFEWSQSSFEKTHAAQPAWRIGKNRGTAFCANTLNCIGLCAQSRCSLLCTDRNCI